MNISVSFSEQATEYSARFEEDSTNFPIEMQGVVINSGNGNGSENGATFTPTVSEDGVISWTNDKGLPNPLPVNIKGAPGLDGNGIDYIEEAASGEDFKEFWIHYTNGEVYAYVLSQGRGKDGVGISDITFVQKTETGVTLAIHYSDDQGHMGSLTIPITDGKDGYTPIKGVDYFDGKDGVNGTDGYTPVKGTDYFTDADKAEMVSAVIAALPVYNGEVVTV